MSRIDVRALVNGKPIDSAVAAMWTAFLNGRWTRERPTKPGKYVIANSAGRVTGEVFVFYDSEIGDLTVRVRDSALCTVKELKEEGIWWWSKPMPQLMPIAVPKEVAARPRPAAKSKPVVRETTETRERARRYEAERRRKLMAQIGLHPMPKWEDER
jgi:hypothetical protein